VNTGNYKLTFGGGTKLIVEPGKYLFLEVANPFKKLGFIYQVYVCISFSHVL